VNNIGDSFGWAFRDPNWLGKLLVQGLIALIPIVGWIAMTGWMMMAFENARAGRTELPPAGFHLERGIAIFLIFLIYAIVFAIPGTVLIVAGVALSRHSENVVNAGSPLVVLGYLLSFGLGLFLRFLIPSLIVNTYHGGIAGGLDFQRVWRLSSFNVTNTVLAALIIFVANLIGGLGFVVCCIGIIFTVPYENTINAGAAAWFEKVQAAPATPPPAAAT
jgi:Protein of unknown function (DUF4013)